MTETGFVVDLDLDGDEVLAAARLALAQDATLDARQITVHLLNRVMVLEGWAVDEEGRQRAQQVVQGVTGVGAVENHIVVQVTQVDDKPLIPRR